MDHFFIADINQIRGEIRLQSLHRHLKEFFMLNNTAEVLHCVLVCLDFKLIATMKMSKILNP